MADHPTGLEPDLPSSSARRRLLQLALVAMGIVLGLLAAEIGARLVYSKPWYEKLIEEQILTQGGPTAPPNSLGLRDRDYSPVKPPNFRRVLILGDSFTYGSGVADDSAIFPRLLEKQLAPEFAKLGITLEVLNCGIPGSLTDDWVDLLAKAGPRFSPDVVLIVFFLRDGTKTTSMDSFFGPIRSDIVQRNRSSRLYLYSYFYRLYRDREDKKTIADSYAAAIKKSYLGTPKQTREWRRAQGNLRRLKTMSEELHATPALVIFPILADLNDDYPFLTVCNEIEHFGAVIGLPTHNLLPAFMYKDPTALWVSPADQHPNELGHRIAAVSILPFLRQLLNKQEHANV